ncbi:MAG: sugar phosphate isomerase/epimerase [Maribacter sp.]|nr:sugar phosphate isomerase/epimerase [Maribacter sp.]
MNNSRRNFIKSSALATTALTVMPSYSFTPMSKGIKTGVQLYSIRDDMGKDPLGSLEALAKMGYKHVEHANYVDGKFYGWSPPEFKKILDDLGMAMPSGHTVLGMNHWDPGKNDFTDIWKQTVADAATMGQNFVISPWLDEKIWTDYDKLLAFMEVFNKCGELCQKYNMRFGYHNHDFEFDHKVNGELLYDIILEKTDPSLVIQQLDFGNMMNGGATADMWLEKYPGRFPSVHVKDEIKSSGDDEYESTLLGKGIVGVEAVIKKCKKIGGTTDFIIEQESYQGKTPMECVETDLKMMKDWGYQEN